MLLSEAKEILKKNGYRLNEAANGVYISVKNDLYETNDPKKVKEILKRRLDDYIDKCEIKHAKEMIDALDALYIGDIEYYKRGKNANGGSQWIQCDEDGNEI